MQLEPPLSLRPLRADDDAFLFRLYASTREELSALSAEDGPLSSLLRQQFDLREVQYRSRHPTASVDAILREGRAIGRLTLDRSGAEIVLVDIALMPAERGQGWGSRVLASLVEEADRARRAIRLTVALENPASRLYRRAGFVAVDDDGVYAGMIRPVAGGAGAFAE